MTLFCIITASILILAAIWLMMRRQLWAPAVAWASLAILLLTSAKVPTLSTVGFWAAAAAIATAINFMLPRSVTDSRIGQGYIAGATIAGMLVGMVISPAAMIVGAIAGAFIGALAFSRTPAGANIREPFSKFINYVCAKGMSAVIAACICGTATSYIILLIQSLK